MPSATLFRPISATVARDGAWAPFGRRDVLVSILIGAVGLGISAIGSGTASLWGDEAASVLSAERSLPSLATMVQHVDAVHALYYLGLHVWIDLVGATPFAVRFPSAIAAGVAAGGLVLLGRLLRGLRYGILAGAVVAVLPRMTDVGSEARSYAMTAAVAVSLTLLLVLLLRSPAPRRRLWIAYGVLLAIGISLFIWLALVAAAQLLVLLLVSRSGSRRVVDLLPRLLVAAGAAVLVASPVLVFAVRERGQIAYLSTRQSYDVISLFVTPWFENPGVAIAGWALLTAGIVITVHAAIRTRGAARAGRLLAVAWMLVPAAALLGFSTVVAVYTPRYLAMCVPAVALLMALPLDALLDLRARTRAVTGVAVILAVLLALISPVWIAQRGPYAKNNSDWAEISRQLGISARPGDAIAFDDGTRPSRRTRLALRLYPDGFHGLLDPTLETPFTQNTTWYDDTYSLAEADALGRLNGIHRIWLVEYAISGAADTDGIAALEAAGFHRQEAIPGARSTILEFVRP